jgi:hypothetical protein
MVRDLLPRWARKAISDLDFAGLTLLLDWIQAEPDCSQVPIPTWIHKGITYHFPTAKGESVSSIEYALADDYYKQFVDGDATALPLLVATIVREHDSDEASALRRDDTRVPLHSKAEVAKRAQALQSAPTELHLQALLYFGGLKAYIHRVYGNWLFEQDEDEDGDDDTERERQTAKPATGGPDFGWWGIFQAVAESGAFGAIDKVYQTCIHDVCIFLVRKRAESQQTPSQSPEKMPEEDDDL